MNETCDRFDALNDDGPDVRAAHQRTCRSCRAQARADAALRRAFPARPPRLSAGFDVRLRRRLESRGGPKRLRRAWTCTLGAYVTAATLASVAILARLPWGTLIAPRELALGLLALAFVSPLLLFDRIGILRPPG